VNVGERERTVGECQVVATSLLRIWRVERIICPFPVKMGVF